MGGLFLSTQNQYDVVLFVVDSLDLRISKYSVSTPVGTV